MITIYAAPLKPNQKSNNGRGVWRAWNNKYSGKYKLCRGLLPNIKMSFLSCNSVRSTLHTRLQMNVPNECTQVNHILNAIQFNDAELHTEVAMVKNNSGPNGKKNYFEETITYLLLADPFSKKIKAGTKKTNPKSSI